MKINKFLKISILVATICYAKSGQNLDLTNGDDITSNNIQNTISSVAQNAMITIRENAEVRFLDNSISTNVDIFALNGSMLTFSGNATSPENRLNSLDMTNSTLSGTNIYVGKIEAKEGSRIELDKIYINQSSTLSSIDNSSVSISSALNSNTYTSLNLENNTNISGVIKYVNLNLTESSTASNVEESVITNISDGSTIKATSSTFESGSINTTGIINTTSSTYKTGATNSTTKAIIEDNGSTFNGEIFANELSLTNSNLTNVSSINANDLTANNLQTIYTGSIETPNIKSTNTTFARRFSTDNLTANNSNFILGGSDDTYTGAIISKISTSGANNTISLLGIVNGGKLQKDKIANLPLTVLKKGNGNATIDNFITKYQALEGIDLYELNPKYMAKGEINGYLVYALDKSGTNANITNMNFRFNDKINEANIQKIADNSSTNQASFERYVNGSEAKNIDEYAKALEGKKENALNKEALEETSQATPNSGNNTNNDNENNTQNPPTENNIVPNNAENTNDIAQNTGNTNKPKSENPKELAMPNLNKQEAQAVAIVDDLIQQVTINKKAVAEVKSLGSSISFSHIFEWNNLNKRMGDLRNLQNDYGVWARFEMTKAELNGYKLSQNEVQAGADKKINLNNGEYFTGFMINASNAEDENKTSKSTNLGFGIYSSMFFDNGYFIDALIRANNHSTKFNHDMFLDELKSNKIGALGNIEFGKRFDECDFYVEPSASLIVAYEPKMNLRSKIADITSDNKLRFHTKASVFGGYHLNEQTTIRMGLGYAMDLNKSSDILLKSNLSQKEEIISGDKYKRGFANIGTNVYFDKNTRLNLEYERSFGGDLKINHQINATLRYSF